METEPALHRLNGSMRGALCGSGGRSVLRLQCDPEATGAALEFSLALPYSMDNPRSDRFGDGAAAALDQLDACNTQTIHTRRQ